MNIKSIEYLRDLSNWMDNPEEDFVCIAANWAADRIEKLENYNERLIHALPMLPKDIKLLRESNACLLDEIEDLKETIRELEAEFYRWKSGELSG